MHLRLFTKRKRKIPGMKRNDSEFKGSCFFFFLLSADIVLTKVESSGERNEKRAAFRNRVRDMQQSKKEREETLLAARLFVSVSIL